MKNVVKEFNYENKSLESNENSSDESIGDSNENLTDHGLPLRDEINLRGSTSAAVTAVSADPSGARAATGTRDGHVYLWDFAGMDRLCRPFRCFEPDPAHSVNDLRWSNSGDCLLVATATQRCTLFDRDGILKCEFGTGDRYLHDQRHTAGHTGAISAARWNPISRDIFASVSSDSTIRIWNCEYPKKQTNVIVFKRGAGASGYSGRPPLTSLCYSSDSKLIAVAAEDGSIRLWNSTGRSSEPVMVVPLAHTPSEAITTLEFGPLNTTASNYILSRAMDGTLRVWDQRNLKKTYHGSKSVMSIFDSSDSEVANCFGADINESGGCATWNPHGRYILYGSAVSNPNSIKRIAILDVDAAFKHIEMEDMPTSEENLDDKKVSTPQATISAIIWHTRLNQIFVGTRAGDCSVRYSESKSWGGALTVNKHRVYRGHADNEAVNEALLYRLANSTNRSECIGDGDPSYNLVKDQLSCLDKMTKRQAQKMRQTRHVTQMPERPQRNRVIGGGVLYSGEIRNDLRDKDPREAILAYAEAAAASPYWVAPAYKRTQPKPVLAATVLAPGEGSNVLPEDHQSKRRRIAEIFESEENEDTQK